MIRAGFLRLCRVSSKIGRGVSDAGINQVLTCVGCGFSLQDGVPIAASPLTNTRAHTPRTPAEKERTVTKLTNRTKVKKKKDFRCDFFTTKEVRKPTIILDAVWFWIIRNDTIMQTFYNLGMSTSCCKLLTFSQSNWMAAVGRGIRSVRALMDFHRWKTRTVQQHTPAQQHAFTHLHKQTHTCGHKIFDFCFTRSDFPIVYWERNKQTKKKRNEKDIALTSPMRRDVCCQAKFST